MSSDTLTLVAWALGLVLIAPVIAARISGARKRVPATGLDERRSGAFEGGGSK